MNKRKTKKIGTKTIVLALVLTICIGTAIFFSGKRILQAVYPVQYTYEIDKYATEYAVPPVLLTAVIHTESGFDPQAVSSAGALGLTQITPETFQWLQTKSGETLAQDALFEPEVSIRYSALFYSLLLTEFQGDTKTAVAAYHAGRGRVNAWLQDAQYSADGKTLDVIPSRDTNHYVSKVLKAIEIYQNLYAKEFDENV